MTDPVLWTGEDGQEWEWGPHFSPDEFRCTHTGKVCVHPDSMDKLVETRMIYGKPIVIVDGGGFRDETHPIEAAKPRPGAHASGRAFDCRVPEDDGHEFLEIVMTVGWPGVGIRDRNDALWSRVFHLDDIPSTDHRPRPRLWTY